MIKTFKKRFRSKQALINWACKNTGIDLIDSCDVMYFITKSRNGKKHYHHFEGHYVPKKEE